MSAPLVFEVEVDGRQANVEVTSPVVAIEQVTEPRVIFAATPGAAGSQGPPGEGVQVFGEIPTGTRDGVNAVFTTANPYRATRTAVYRNGIREIRGTCFTESGAAEITFSTPPLDTDDITIDYIIQ